MTDTTPRALLDRIYETGTVQDADGHDRDPFPQASPREATDALREVVQALDARSTLEVGLAYGLSALAICEAHLARGEGAHVAVDPKQDTWHRVGLANAERAGLGPYFTHVAEPSEQALPRLWAEGLTLDFAFIDGLHLFDHCLIDFFYVDRMLRVGGVVGIDDLWMPAMRRVVAFARTNRAYEVMTVHGSGPEGARMGVMRAGKRVLQAVRGGEVDRSGLAFSNTNVAFLRKTKDDDRRWHHHVPF